MTTESTESKIDFTDDILELANVIRRPHITIPE
jgi:hypothetical protein